MGKLKIREIKDLNSLVRKNRPENLGNTSSAGYLDDFSEENKIEIFFSEEASNALHSDIFWGRRSFQNETEQMGLLVGNFCNAAPEGAAPDVWIEVKHIIPCRNPEISRCDYIKISPENWKKMYEELDRVNTRLEQEFVVVGWYHTHPGNIPAVFSNIDFETHSSQFTYEYSVGVVLNPHRKTWKAYYGPECKECKCYIPERKQKALYESGMNKEDNNRWTTEPKIFQYDWYGVQENFYWTSEAYIQRMGPVYECWKFRSILCELSGILKSNYEIMEKIDSELKGMIITGVLLEKEEGKLELDFNRCHFYHEFQELNAIRENKGKNKLAILFKQKDVMLLRNASWIARFMQHLGVKYLVFCSPHTDICNQRYGFEIFVKR